MTDRARLAIIAAMNRLVVLALVLAGLLPLALAANHTSATPPRDGVVTSGPPEYENVPLVRESKFSKLTIW